MENYKFIPKFSIGDIVCFCDNVFKPPFFPYYEEYRGHQFKVAGYGREELHEDPHAVALKCTTDPSVIVKGNVHEHNIKRVGK